MKYMASIHEVHEVYGARRDYFLWGSASMFPASLCYRGRNARERYRGRGRRWRERYRGMRERERETAQSKTTLLIILPVIKHQVASQPRCLRGPCCPCGKLPLGPCCHNVLDSESRMEAGGHIQVVQDGVGEVEASIGMQVQERWWCPFQLGICSRCWWAGRFHGKRSRSIN